MVLIALLALAFLHLVVEEVSAIEWGDDNEVYHVDNEFEGRVDADGDLVCALFTDGHGYVMYSLFDGERWSVCQQIDPSGMFQDRPQVSIYDGIIHVVWMDQRDGDFDIYYASHNGTQWSRPVVISMDTRDESQLSPDIGAHESGVHVVWAQENRGDNDIYYTMFDGRSWSRPEIISSDATGNEVQSSPRIAVDKEEVHVVWDETSLTSSGHIQYVSKVGGRWSQVMNLTEPSRQNVCYSPCIDASGGDVYVAYPNASDVSYIEMRIRRAKVWSDPFPVGRTNTTAQYTTPDVAASSGHVTVVYSGPGTANGSIYVSHFDGEDWTDGQMGGVSKIGTPTDIALSNGTVHVIGRHRATMFRYLYHRTGAIESGPPDSWVRPLAEYWMAPGGAVLEWEAYDDWALSGLTLQYRYSAENETWSTWSTLDMVDGLSGSRANGRYSFVPADGDGFYQFRSIATDRAGNAETAPTAPDAVAGLDTVDPSCSIVINGGDEYSHDPNVTLTLTFDDATSGVAKVRFGEDMIGGDEPWEDPVETRVWDLGTTEGPHTIAFQVMDAVGHKSSEEVASIFLDLTDPTGTITMQMTGEWTTTQDVTLELTYGDAGSGVSMVRFGDEAIGGDEPWENPVDTRQWTLPEGDGTHTVAYQVLDNSGRTSEVYTVSKGLDTTAPTGSIIMGGSDTVTTERTVTLSLTAHDDTSGVAGIRVGNEEFIGGDEPWENPVETLEWELSEGSGAKTVYYQVVDAAGLTSQVYTTTIILDLDHPLLTVEIEGGMGYVQDHNVTVTIGFSDETSSVVAMRFSHNGFEGWTDWQNPVSTLEWELLPGEEIRFIFVEVRDEAGWNTTVEDHVWVDTIAPTVSETEPVEGASEFPVDGSIFVHLSETMNTTVVEEGTILYLVKDGDDPQGVSVKITWDQNRRRMYLEPLAPLEEATRYRLDIGEDVVDKAGNPMEPFSLSFTTEGGGDEEDEGTPWALIVALLAIILVMGAIIAFLLLRKGPETT